MKKDEYITGERAEVMIRNNPYLRELIKKKKGNLAKKFTAWKTR